MDTTLNQESNLAEEKPKRQVDFSDPPPPRENASVKVSQTEDNEPSTAPSLWLYQRMPDYSSLTLKSKFRLMGDTRYNPADKEKLKKHILDLFENGENAEVHEIYLEANGQQFTKTFPLKLYLLRLEENKGDITVSAVEEIRGDGGLTGLKVKV